MSRYRSFALYWLLLILGSTPAMAADPFASAGNSSNLLQADQQFLPVEQAYQLSVRLDGGKALLEWNIAPGYYLYKDNFAVQARGMDGVVIPTRIHAGKGREIYDDYYGKNLEVFYDSTLVSVDFLQPPPPAITLSVTSQGCADAGLCYPPHTQYFTADLAAGAVAPTAAPSPAAGTASSVSAGSVTASAPGLLTLLGFAILGGLILNLMPCVFPVLSIKVMSLTTAHAHRHRVATHGLAYGAGVVLSFVAIAVLLLILRRAGEAVGWGFQLQSPGFVTALAYLFFLMALGFGGQLPLLINPGRLGGSAARGNGLGASFLTGVLATVVASPCSAPFMGTALGVALTLPPALTLGVFAALGFGMALPFLVLTALPGLLRRLPRPGPWMETFRQLLAFPLYATVLWLLWVLGRQTDIDRVLAAAFGLLLVALAAWLACRSRHAPGRVVAAALLVAGLGLPLAQPAGAPAEHPWEPYSAARLEALRNAGAPVFVNLTADWCITCLANERMALSSELFRTTLKQRGIHYLKGDWTRYDPEITALLSAHGRSGVPLYLYFPPGEPARILPQLLTETIVLSALNAPPGVAPTTGGIR
ncbi:MAG: protein-disulfide reductase DsbD [Gammaproteobacteria bacterium]|nr:protein-disulfide reductase DsbD [Gammaproteobacteria bacterium]